MTAIPKPYPDAWRKQPMISSPLLRYGLYLAIAGYLAAVLGTMEVDWQRARDGVPRAGDFLAAFFPPDFTSRGDAIRDGLLESLAMTVASTVLGVALSVPFALGAARNIAPAPVYFLCRGFIAIARSFQEVILAVFLVALFGFGPFAGLLTLVIATIGFFAKLMAEDLEDMDPRPVEAVRATGAVPSLVLMWAVWPQVAPRFIGLSLYRLDINFRESAIVGIVGGGGIGATLNTAFDRYEFASAAAILIVIIAIVLAVEWTSGLIRRWVQ